MSDTGCTAAAETGHGGADVGAHRAADRLALLRLLQLVPQPHPLRVLLPQLQSRLLQQVLLPEIGGDRVNEEREGGTSGGGGGTRDNGGGGERRRAVAGDEYVPVGIN